MSVELTNDVLSEAFKCYPERFKYREPDAGSLHEAVWINPPGTNKEGKRQRKVQRLIGDRVSFSLTDSDTFSEKNRI